jgi:hypothetical protein
MVHEIEYFSQVFSQTKDLPLIVADGAIMGTTTVVGEAHIEEQPIVCKVK